MRFHLQEIAPTVGLALVVACETSVPPATSAATAERMQCDPGAIAPESTQLLHANAVLSVQPIYSLVHVNTNNQENRVSGAKLVLRPPAGVSAELMTRILQCHSARVLLGRVSSDDIPNDPYLLADHWLDIQVTPEDGNFTVTIRAGSVPDNLEVLGRATRYAHEHMLARESRPSAP